MKYSLLQYQFYAYFIILIQYVDAVLADPTLYYAVDVIEIENKILCHLLIVIEWLSLCVSTC